MPPEAAARSPSAATVLQSNQACAYEPQQTQQPYPATDIR
jgi:hypothetical protein